MTTETGPAVALRAALSYANAIDNPDLSNAMKVLCHLVEAWSWQSANTGEEIAGVLRGIELSFDDLVAKR